MNTIYATKIIDLLLIKMKLEISSMISLGSMYTILL